MHHVREGWTFERLDSGEVRVAKYVTPFVDATVTPLQTQLVLSSDEWDSVVKEVGAKPKRSPKED